MRPILIAANWKMNTTPADAGALAAEIARATQVANATRIICPPYTGLVAVRDAVAGTGTLVGAQNVHAEAKGAYTGEISADMLKGLVSWCIVGQSERRRDHFESDELVGQKIVRLADAGISPMLCCGEQLEEREAGVAVGTVQAQVRASLETVLAAGIDLPADLAIAYEPVWAIGTGMTATGHDAAEMADAIRSVMADLAGAEFAESVPVLYGGSVTAEAFGEFIGEPAIDGALIGGASLKVDQMAGIAALAAEAAAGRSAA
jgi:triosephosphate isomerase